MDCIPLPSNPFHPQLDVPHLGSHYPLFDYDGQGFLDFPVRKAVDPSSLSVQKNLCGKLPIEVLTFIQSWCYLGLLIEVLKAADIHVTVQDFVRRDIDERGEETSYITSKGLPRLLHTWKARARNLGEAEKLKRSEIIKKYMHTARNFIFYGTRTVDGKTGGRLPGTEGLHDIIVDAVHISILVLGDYLGQAVRIYEPYCEKFVWGSNNYLKHRMMQAGWCRSEIFNLVDYGIRQSSMYYLGFMSRHSLKRDHTRCTDSFRCTFDKLDEKKYRTSHTPECSQSTDFKSVPNNCSDINLEPPWAHRISRIVRKNQTPLITVTEDLPRSRLIVKIMTSQLQKDPPDFVESITDVIIGNQTLFLGLPQVFESENQSTRPYVCISHVWSDGLGNPIKNSLPRCQLLRIQRLVNELYPEADRPIPFWLDTVCVPRERKYRDIAIAAMKQIYRGADKVLVLDSVLTQVPTDCGPLEMLMRIRTGGWARRLWTFQEAGLAKELYYQFLDHAVTAKDISMALKEYHVSLMDGKSQDSTELGAESLMNFNDITMLGRYFIPDLDPVGLDGMIFFKEQEDGGKSLDADHPQVLVILTASLCWRWTSWLEDETICLAGILGHDVTDLLSHPPHHRMKAFISAFKYIQPSIIFCQQERLQEDGDRWIPKSFLGGGQAGQIPWSLKTEVAFPSARGLFVIFPGMIILGQIVNHDFWFRCETADLLYHVFVVYPERIEWQDLRHAELAVILENPIYGGDGPPRGRGALVTIFSTEHDIIYTRLRHQVLVEHRKKSTVMAKDIDIVKDAARFQWTATNQVWCVG